MRVKFSPWHVKNEHEDFWGFQIEDGKYSGTGVSLNDIQLPEKDHDLLVDYTIMKNADGFSDDDYKTKEFEAVLSDVLIQMLTAATENLKDETRNSDTSEPNI